MKHRLPQRMVLYLFSRQIIVLLVRQNFNCHWKATHSVNWYFLSSLCGGYEHVSLTQKERKRNVSRILKTCPVSPWSWHCWQSHLKKRSNTCLSGLLNKIDVFVVKGFDKEVGAFWALTARWKTSWTVHSRTCSLYHRRCRTYRKLRDLSRKIFVHFIIHFWFVFTGVLKGRGTKAFQPGIIQLIPADRCNKRSLLKVAACF